MKELEGFMKNETPSIIKDPFNKKGFNGLQIFVRKSSFRDAWNISGDVDFTNGNTKGRQEFTSDTLDQLLIEIKTFLEQLQ